MKVDRSLLRHALWLTLERQLDMLPEDFTGHASLRVNFFKGGVTNVNCDQSFSVKLEEVITP